MHNFLAAHPTECHFTRKQWSHHFQIFQRLLKETYLLNGDDALASVFRMGVIFFRMAMTFSALRKYERGDTSSVIYCSETNYKTVNRLANIFIRTPFFCSKSCPRAVRQLSTSYQIISENSSKTYLPNFEEKMP